MIAIIGLSAAIWFLLYVLAGYPLLLDLLARYRARPVRRGPFQPRVSIIVAVYNGQDYIEQKLRSVLALRYPRDKVQIIVASDGSTDRTDELVRNFAAEGVRLLVLPRAGKPSVLNAAVVEASGDILVFTDVRQRLESDSLSYLMENFADPAVGAVSGELVILDGSTSEEANVGLYWRYELAIRLRLSALDSIFGATGAYYAIRRELTVPIPADALLDDMHLPLAAFFRGYRLIVDTRARMFDYPIGLQGEFHRKVRTLAGNYQILHRYPALLGPGNRLWFHFVSYKLARLLLPFALIAVFLCSWFLPFGWAVAFLAGQVLFYGAAAVDPRVPEGPAKRITAPVRTFVTLMAASFCAGSILFLPGARFWKQTRPTKTDAAPPIESGRKPIQS